MVDKAQDNSGEQSTLARSKTTVEVRTLADLARIAGVSAGTVSRALAGKSLVNTETRERIQKLAREYGFRPNQMASKLRSRRTGVIGVVIPLGHDKRQHVSDPFFLTLLGALADELTESGYDLMLSRAIPDHTSDWLERMTGSGMVDGVIVIGQSDQFDTIERVAANYRPMVVWGQYRTGQTHCVVGTDNAAGGRMAARKLIDGGARRLAFLGSTTGIEIAIRFEGARQEAARAGIGITHIPVHLADEEMADEVAAALGYGSGSEYDGIIAASDLIAMGALRVLFENGHQVPVEVQVIGFDDLPLSAQTHPPLTTIRQEIHAGARAMVERLKALIDNSEAESLVMEPRVVTRASTR
ncbi:LacI family DNA-binding transcriptional regulator [Novosphingobium sp. YJ-S2-02]|uniref:LacI family DNA-binding transcriptional regulator n=1 Tax=Novosphingobium aureum TaxID=2792964 RepID=A0A931MM19_9SPHN|nr:LacI family DNA-binding transcriptional regulator [Novosphingobium aureum]MBH0114024.1 LacI family DNA-binding transcriptional regulator [Novosphingobium aureum]